MDHVDDNEEQEDIQPQIDEFDDELNRDPKFIVRRKFNALHYKVLRQITLLRKLTKTFENFKQTLKLAEILREQVVFGLLDMTIPEFVSKILPIMEDIKTIKQSMAVSKSIPRRRKQVLSDT